MATKPTNAETPPKLRLVCSELATVEHKILKIGVQLGVPNHKLKLFEKDDSPLLTAVVNDWLEGNAVDIPVTWRSVVKALKDDSVGEIGLANKISEKHCRDGPIEPPAADGPIESPAAADVDAGTPYYTSDKQKDLYFERMPLDLPEEKTDEYQSLEKFSKEVEIILQTVNENEYQAATTFLQPPNEHFNKAVIFPKNCMVLGNFARKKTALIQTRAGSKAGNFIEKALKSFPNTVYIIGVGVCFAYKISKMNFGDVIVSTTFCPFTNSAIGEKVEDRGERIDVVEDLQDIFCRSVTQKKFIVSKEGRDSKVHPGLITSFPYLIRDASFRDKLHAGVSNAIGGEMEGEQLLNIKRAFGDQGNKVEEDKKEGYQGDKVNGDTKEGNGDTKEGDQGNKVNGDKKQGIKGVIVIKGVADFADRDKEKCWQFTSAMAALHYTQCKLVNELDFNRKGGTK